MPIMINETTEETQDQRPRIYPDEIMRHMQKILDGEIKGITMADILLGKIQGDDPRTFGQYLDPKDHETERERVNKCEEEFRQLPACVRLHFNNDVGQVITYLNIHGPKTEKGPDVHSKTSNDLGLSSHQKKEIASPEGAQEPTATPKRNSPAKAQKGKPPK